MNIIGAIFLCLTFFLTTSKEDQITWSQYDQLTWDDFRGKVPSKRQEAAETGTSMSFGYSFNGQKLDWQLNCFFVPSESWVKKDSKSPELLSHEQLHFDIAELQARKIRSEIIALGSLTERDVKKIEDIYEKGFKKMSAMQRDYDNNTQHGLKKDEQKQWTASIRRELESLKDFSSSKYNTPEN